MKKTKLLLLGLPLIAVATGTLTGCSNDKPVEEDVPHYTTGNYRFQTIYRNTGSFTFEKYDDTNPSKSKKITYYIDKSIKNFNYIKLELETDTDMVGWLSYVNEDNKEESNTEKFFVKAGDTEFRTFLDSFRAGGFGRFKNKRITSIAFQGVDTSKCGTFSLKSIAISDRTYSNEKMFIDDGTIKLGTSVNYGGSIEWLERIDINIVEYIDAGGNVRIDKDIDPSTIKESRLISSSVNMVNTYDLGREVQPSYYLNVNKEANGYDPKTEYKYESISGNIKYNPIQCGGVGDISKGIITEPQVIDYEYTKDRIYVKTKGQDWMFVNDQAEGYIEATYHFGDDGLLIVDNSYVDFYQFANLNSVDNPMDGQETPATYFVYPLNYFYCKTKTRTINDPFVGPQGSGYQAIEDPSATLPGAGNYFYAIRSGYMKNRCDWVANVNDQRFGAGIYMPNADYYIASRGSVSNSYSNKQNSSYTDRFYDFGDGLTPSYAASNYNYINPQLRRRMIEFVPLQFTYALFIGDVSEMEEAFDNAKSQGLTNECLTMSTGTWPKH